MERTRHNGNIPKQHLPNKKRNQHNVPDLEIIHHRKFFNDSICLSKNISRPLFIICRFFFSKSEIESLIIIRWRICL